MWVISMYCSSCGTKIKSEENFCTNCGKEVVKPEVVDIEEKKSTENFRITSIVLGGLSLGSSFFFLLSPLSLILGIIGLVFAIKSHKNSNNTVGIVLNSIGVFISFIVITIFALMINLVINVVKYGVGELDNIYDYIEEQGITNGTTNDF